MEKNKIGKHIVKLLLEGNDNIDSLTMGKLSDKDHYLAKNKYIPQTLSDKGLLFDEVDAHFDSVEHHLKRAYNVSDVTPKEFFKIKTDFETIYNEILEEEDNCREQLEILGVFILQKVLGFDDSEIELKIELNKTPSLVDNTFEKVETNNVSYDEILSKNEKVEKNKLLYSIICGAANSMSKLHRRYENTLDNINPNLYTLYGKLTAFTEFNMWVTPDDVWEGEMEATSSFSIEDNGEKYIVLVQSPNFVYSLYESVKALFLILSNIKIDDETINKNSVWNDRVGSIIWNKLVANLQQKPLAAFFYQFSELDNEGFKYFLGELLNDTDKAKDIINQL